MIKSYLSTNLNKLIALGIGSLLCFTLIYKVTFSKTIALYKAQKSQKGLLANSKNLHAELEGINAKLANVQASLLQPYDKKNILEKVTDFCKSNDLMVLTFPTTQSNTVSSYDILTNEIEVKGKYASIVELIYLIERKEKLGSVNNIKFQLVKNKQTKIEELTAKITLRNLEA